ncbi:type II toxin-antitoxin system HicB family antitoxin [Neptuniibacter sp. PT34_22]|uniref:type II toxin-antitoxin system HicB family antitoxin n=1 Tax=Neptuniibacter sp. PT34_22 TaxID=3398205 RepID=UPI0039F5B4AC
MLYPIFIEKEPDSDYGVIVPDIPGCFSAGSTYEDALYMAKDAIEGHFETLAEDGEEIPAGSSLEVYKDQTDYQDGIWALVDVDITPYLGKAQKINVTLPGRLINKIDQAVAEKSLYGNRSNFLAKAAMRELGIE